MATLGHVAAGAVGARWRAGRVATTPLVFSMVGLVALALLPDIDFIAFHLGIPYRHPFGHRGATHSPAFAILVGALVAATLRAFGRRVLRDALLVTAVVATHGLLDALTTGGLGVEFFWPFSPARYFLPVRFIPVAPLGGGMLSTYGAAVLGVEAVLFLPAWLYAFWPRREPAVESQSVKPAA